MAVSGNRGMLADDRVFVNNGLESAGRPFLRSARDIYGAFGDIAIEPLYLLNCYNIVS